MLPGCRTDKAPEIGVISERHLGRKQVATYDIGFWGDTPMLVASFCQTFDDVCLVTHKP